MASETEVEAAARAYLDFEPAEGEEVWSRVHSAMRAALAAAEAVREPAVFTTADGRWHCTVNGPQHIVCVPVDKPAAGDAP